jgi:DNA modification methylase
MELNKVYNEDCLIGMSRIADKSVDMILCDLPYGTTQNRWDSVIPFQDLWRSYERVIKDNGAIVLTAQTPFDKVLGASKLDWLKYEWIWEKDRPTGFLNANKMPMKAHENVLVFYKCLPTYNPQKTYGHKPMNKSGKALKKTSNYGNFEKVETGGNTERHPRSIIEFNVVNSQHGIVHPTQKPVALFEYLIKTYTNEGETVLDNCMGSGTTAIACINTNRNYIGFEKEEKYYQIIQDRIKKHTPQLKLIA